MWQFNFTSVWVIYIVDTSSHAVATGSCDVSAALPCMLGTSLLQTAGGRLHSSSHKRDKTLPKTHTEKHKDQSGIYLPRITSHKHTGGNVYLQYFFYSSELHSPFVLAGNTGDVKIGKVSRFPRDTNCELYTTRPT